jgi:serine-type D-Ala-D-Ala carboxypeptidase
VHKISVISALASICYLLACTPDADSSDAESTLGTGPGTGPPSSEGLHIADSLVASWVSMEAVPGAVLRVTLAGQPVLEAAYGFAQLADFGSGQYPPVFDDSSSASSLRLLDEPLGMTITTVFDLASVTKVMATTMAIMLLVDRGSIDLEAPASRYLSDFTGDGKSAITITHLLTHRSGLEQWKPTYYHAADAEEAYAYIRDLPLGWPVGEGRHYSDLGFMLLGRIVETVSGLPLDQFVANQVYDPLGLKATGYRRATDSRGRGPGNGALLRHPVGSATPDGAFAATSHGNPFERRMVYDSAFGYSIAGDPSSWDAWRRYTLVGEVNDGNAFHAFGGVAGHAGLFSTARELGVLLQMLLDGGAFPGGRFVSQEIVARFLTTTGESQALGWQTPDDAPVGSFVHTGFTGTFVLGVPELGLAVVLLTNRQNDGVNASGSYPDVGPLQRAVLQALTR